MFILLGIKTKLMMQISENINLVITFFLQLFGDESHLPYYEARLR